MSKIARKYIRRFHFVSLFNLYYVLSIFVPLRAISISFSFVFVLSGYTIYMENNGRTKTRWNRTETVKHAKNLIKQGDKEGCYYVLIFIAIFIPSKNPHTKPYNISVTRQQFSLVSLGYLCSQSHCVPLDTHNIDTNCILSHHSHLRQRFRACVIALAGNRPHRDRGGGGGGLSYLSVLKGKGRRLEEGISAIVNGGSCCLLAVLYSFKNLPRLITITLSRDIRRGL